MRKLTTAAIGAACLVAGAGVASLYAQSNAPYYEIAEINVKDVDAYKKAMPQDLHPSLERGPAALMLLAALKRPNRVSVRRWQIVTLSFGIQTKRPPTSFMTTV